MPNTSTTLVEPTELEEVISSTSAIAPRWRSSGVATLEDIVSGLAPGIAADTKITGKSKLGKGATGSRKNAARPDKASPIVSSVVATGRSMKTREKFMA